MFKTHSEYQKYISELPKELQEIYFQCWDFTGRPSVQNPATLCLELVLLKNSDKNYDSFFKDYMTLLPHSDPIIPELTYAAFMSGARFIAQRIQQDFKSSKKTI